MKVLNRWNRKWYKVLCMTDRDVTLQREDGTSFTIARNEFYAAYVNVDELKNNKK